MNDYEAHLSSYDHTHKQRLKDMKAMVRDPGAAARARRIEQKAEGGVINIKLGGGEAAGAGAGAGGGGFKKGGFKKTGFKAAFGSAKEDDVAAAGAVTGTGLSGGGLTKGEGEVKMSVFGGESDTEDEGYEVYDPRKPTD